MRKLILLGLVLTLGSCVQRQPTPPSVRFVGECNCVRVEDRVCLEYRCQ